MDKQPQDFVFAFGDDIGDASPSELLGGKGAGLSEMTRLGISVPPGFTISTNACRVFSGSGSLPPDLERQVREGVRRLEETIGKRLGDPSEPLLVSVRSGAARSMPGMMDTILNLGLNDETVEGLAHASQDRRFAFDAYRRLVEMYGDVVLGVERKHFDACLTETKRSLGNEAMPDHEVPAATLETLVGHFKTVVREHAKTEFPSDVEQQLWGAIEAVFRSWENPRARRYRRMQEIPDTLGTAVNVQSMVFGNLGPTSGSGVCFTRNPSNGSRMLYGEFLANAQGEDVVAGIRTPKPLAAQAAAPGKEAESLERAMPDAYETIAQLSTRLEGHFKDLQDIEFTIERGKVFVLQTRNGKRAAHAAVKIAVDMVDEGVITPEEALLRVEPETLEQLLHARIPGPDSLARRGIHPIARGLPASPGAAIGRIVLDADEAERLAGEGTAVILVRRETSPEDIHGMKAAAGIVTATGGMTSHAAVVARGLGKPCIAGSTDLTVDYESGTVTTRDPSTSVTLHPGDVITLDGASGCLYRGELDVEAAAKVPEFERLMEWADDRRRLRVRANADTPRGARTARAYGAEGIGLCRTEHMFFADDRLEAVRCMVLADDESKREHWLANIAPMQRGDFVEIFKAMDGLPVTVRLLDWPLHEFLPRERKDYERVARALGESVEVVEQRARSLAEVNPMLGHRGVRLGLTTPAIYRMQVRAIAEAALLAQSEGAVVKPEIMIPVVAVGAELREMIARVRATLAEVEGAAALEIPVGTMIELPRACLVAAELAQAADFFSFGTNDLTQTTFGISRDDAGTFLSRYIGDSPSILPTDPFARLDVAGVGALVHFAVDAGRAACPGLKTGICGEHGGDPRSIAFAERIGLDYLSCSPPRLPVARLAAAQAILNREEEFARTEFVDRARA